DSTGATMTDVTFTWTATGGTITSTGSYTAGSTAGTFSVKATSGTVSGSATVTVTAPATSTVVAYPKVPQLATSTNYSLSVNGTSVPVGLYKGHAIAWFAFSGTANVVVTVSQPVTSYTLSPKRNQVPSTVSANQI